MTDIDFSKFLPVNADPYFGATNRTPYSANFMVSVQRELAARLHEHGHATDLGLRELIRRDRLTKHNTIGGVGPRRVERGLHDTDGARRSLQATVLEAFHLQVEAAADARLAADQRTGRHPPILERDLIGVHAAIADRVDRPTDVESEHMNAFDAEAQALLEECSHLLEGFWANTE